MQNGKPMSKKSPWSKYPQKSRKAGRVLHRVPEGTDYERNPEWRPKLLTPAQFLIHDVRVEHLRMTGCPRLEVMERPSTSILPPDVSPSEWTDSARASQAATNPIEEQQFLHLESEYGWMRSLRLQAEQLDSSDHALPDRCRWIHCYSKFEEYLKGFLWALSDDRDSVAEGLRHLENAMQQHTRFSKHGKYFNAFSTSLRSSPSIGEDIYPMLISVPFLDWSIQGAVPPLRFQVDKREGFRSTATATHMIRSVLQHFYRLEDTSDRERSQVFAKHKPWNTDRDLDLKVRQWYGRYPTALNVDELWLLIIDAGHIVTFSSNQTWKARTPPLQLASRVSDISFRGIRNTYFPTDEETDYSAMTHGIVAINAAVGLMHRKFWGDFILPATDRYAGYLSHLQYLLHRAPSSKLVMDLMACQEELNIVIQIIAQQLELITDLLEKFRSMESEHRDDKEFLFAPDHSRAAHSKLYGPANQMLDDLQRERTDFRELRDNTDRLVTRTIQLVNIRLEDHGKAILVFTVVTIIFLPLNFVSSFFGMNVADIRDLHQGQWIFWAVAICVTVGVVGGSLFLAFSGGSLWQSFVVWRDRQKELRLNRQTAAQQMSRPESESSGFRLIGTTARATGF